ncbi:MAG: YidB family protein [Methylotenera sp.]|nr:YidB family protein [Methylotenera sp.]MDD4926342.1 YidB family protein [Methylotenera sp.]
MGLFDSLAGAVLSKAGGDKGAMVQVAMDLFNQNGGLEGVIEKFKAGGLAEQAASWVGKGENLPISAEQISQVLGSDAVAGIAEKLGMDTNDISNKIAEYLPQVIDKMTPDGEVNANSGSLMSAILGMMK